MEYTLESNDETGRKIIKIKINENLTNKSITY